jgi:tetratricopeptide (TPR) repeat protein
MTPEQIEEHNRAYTQAAQMVKGEIILDGSPQASVLNSHVQLKLEQAIRLFEHVLELNPENWSARWLVGKAYQRLGNYAAAFISFAEAHAVNPLQPDVLREASICAMYMGRSEEAISYARSALESQRSDGSLRANLALALLLADKLDAAKQAIDKATIGGAMDTISQTIGRMIDHFIAVGQKPPTTTAALESYWKNRPK